MKSKLSNIYRRIISLKKRKRNVSRLKNSDFTIFSSNCIGGVIYSELSMEFKSPTINLYIKPKDFIKFLKNPTKYMECELVEKEDDTYKYPVAYCDDIKIFGMHYSNFRDLKEKWDKRKERVKLENVFVIMLERDGCTYDDLIEFDKLPYENKVVFVHKAMPEIKSAFFIPGTEIRGDEINKINPLTLYVNKFSGKRYIDGFDYVSFLNGNMNG